MKLQIRDSSVFVCMSCRNLWMSWRWTTIGRRWRISLARWGKQGGEKVEERGKFKRRSSTKFLRVGYTACDHGQNWRGDKLTPIPASAGAQCRVPVIVFMILQMDCEGGSLLTLYRWTRALRLFENSKTTQRCHSTTTCSVSLCGSFASVYGLFVSLSNNFCSSVVTCFVVNSFIFVVI